MSKAIPSLKVLFTGNEKKYIQDNIGRVLDSGYLTLGRYTKEFEDNFKKISGTKCALAVNSGTTALEIIFRILDVDRRDVLIPSNTNFATAIAAVNAGARPIFYDGDAFPNLKSIERKITPKTKVIVVVHIGGYICENIFEIKKLCIKRGIFLVEDAAHAHGSEINGVAAGSIGDFGAFSFFPTKVITTCEGGMIVASNNEFIQKAAIYRDQGKDESGIRNILPGNSWRMSEIEAVVGLAQLKNFHKDTKHRREIIDLYYKELNKLPISFPKTSCKPSGYKVIISVKNEKEATGLKTFLKEQAISTGKGVYDIPLHLQPVFKKFNKSKLPISEKFSKIHICLPIWRFMKKQEVKRVCDVIKLFYSR
ncbi:MAG: DegT/DnrJ/EryC1/StrS family aminotransferase [Candidatus Moranbacteria bacterium]|nr:DegT/DnrJ/EryC1/StrS family aminotransferase [Candidatus Moranbacteria bacterium]